MKLFEDKLFYKKLISIGLPIALQNLVYSLLNMIDTVMIGTLGEVSISAVGAANKVFFVLNLIFFGVNSGSAIFTSQYWGVKDIKSIKKVLGLSLTICVVGSMPLAIGAIFFPEPLMRIFSSDKEVIKVGCDYLNIIGISYCISAISFSFMFICRTIGQVKLPLVISTLAVCVNAIFNYMLIFGKFGAPALGVKGAALATTISRVFEVTILLIIIYGKKYPLAAKFSELFDWSKQFVFRFIKTTLPVFINESIWGIGTTIYSIIYGIMGNDVFAATTISQTIEQISMVLFIGLGNAAAVMIGNELGAKNFDKAYTYSKKFSILGPIIGVIIGVLVIIISPFIPMMFNVKPIVKEYIQGCIVVLGLFLPFKVYNMVNIVGILRSGGDVRFTLLIDFVGVWAVGVPLAAIAGVVLHLNIYWVYAFVLCEEVVKFIIGLPRYLSKKWLNNIIA